MCVNTYFDTICVHTLKSAYSLFKMRTAKQSNNWEYVNFVLIKLTL